MAGRHPSILVRIPLLISRLSLCGRETGGMAAFLDVFVLGCPAKAGRKHISHAMSPCDIGQNRSQTAIKLTRPLQSRNFTWLNDASAEFNLVDAKHLISVKNVGVN